jgi:hypothetical protein
LTDPGKQAEITGGLICSLILFGQAIVLFLPRSKSDVTPSHDPADRERPPEQPEGSSSGDAPDTRVQPGPDQIRRSSE